MQTLGMKYLADLTLALLKILGSAELFASSISVVGNVSDGVITVIMNNLRTLINSPKGIFRQVFVSLLTFIPNLCVQVLWLCTGILGLIVRFTAYLTFHTRYKNNWKQFVQDRNLQKLFSPLWIAFKLLCISFLRVFTAFWDIPIQLTNSYGSKVLGL